MFFHSFASMCANIIKRFCSSDFIMINLYGNIFSEFYMINIKMFTRKSLKKYFFGVFTKFMYIYLVKTICYMYLDTIFKQKRVE